jgi:hypothetical protein
VISVAWHMLHDHARFSSCNERPHVGGYNFQTDLDFLLPAFCFISMALTSGIGSSMVPVRCFGERHMFCYGVMATTPFITEFSHDIEFTTSL